MPKFSMILKLMTSQVAQKKRIHKDGYERFRCVSQNCRFNMFWAQLQVFSLRPQSLLLTIIQISLVTITWTVLQKIFVF